MVSTAEAGEGDMATPTFRQVSEFLEVLQAEGPASQRLGQLKKAIDS
jgi:hypothetical protein